MKQEIIAGIVLCAIGMLMLIFPKQIWKITEAWKTSSNAEPSERYFTVLRAAAIGCVVLGILLIFAL